MSLSHRRPIAIAAATLTAAALGATALMLPAVAAERPTVPIKIVGGTLDWGVKESYRNYVTGMAAGKITVADGAVRNADGTFRFGSATGQYDPATHVVKAAFQGSVTFFSPAPPAGHGFEVKLSDFRIDSGTKKVTADVTKGGKTDQDVPLAGVAFTGPAMEKLATTLTKQAADSLGSASYENKPGDPLTVKPEFEQPKPQPSGQPSTKPTPSSTTTKPAPTQTSGTPATPSKPPAQTTKPADGPQKILSGKATWGMKESFRRYVQGAGGSVTPAAGAVKNGELFDFTLGKGELDAKNKKLTASFNGSLRFLYAAHGIDMTFSNLRVTAAGKTGTLVLDVKTASGTRTGVPFATLDLSKADYRTKGGVLTLNSVPAVFTAEGAAVFANGTTGSMYQKGQAVDPLTLSVAVDRDAALPSGTAGGSGSSGGTGGTGGAGTAGGGGSVGGNLAATGAEIPAGSLLAASGVVVAAGAGAVFAARRRRTAGI
ncbi:hypothetical protein DEJ50_23765 [Streptomyces venezuelae]|uniref:Htaa domain-containing protein n=1 Tax=Streptomyces venezuelae TaxID=54571 RepID=A0A5P2D5C3_STRVZ|nr:HtaA domain-containing protein [Streptomyces venezuelae]QES50385.1 hypothetical protein DEJ50_23765 [Streptomyces venezuelae]